MRVPYLSFGMNETYRSEYAHWFKDTRKQGFVRKLIGYLYFKNIISPERKQINYER